MPRNKRIAHLIVRLDTGGAEKSLYRLVRSTTGQLTHHVICFGPKSSIGLDIAATGVTVTWLDYKVHGPLVLWQALRILRSNPPHVLQGWMYLGNLIASLLKLGLPRGIKTVWNIRTSLTDFSNEKRRTRWIIALARLPWFAPDLVIYNSFSGQQAHQRFGFNRGANTVIVNGIDIEEFKPAPEARAHWRDLHEVVNEPWIGLVSRFHPHKGVAEFLQAVRLLLDSEAGPMRFLLAGPGMVRGNAQLLALLARYKIDPQQIDLVGPLDATSQFLPALDVLVIASLREGTPNILLEAMACGVKTVATRVGDVERILGDPARLACPGDATDLAHKISQALDVCDDAVEQQRVTAERSFVQRYYHTGQCMDAYLKNYQELTN